MKCPFVMKRCKKCNELLVANTINFYKKKDGKYGLRSRCKKCDNAQKKKYYEENKEECRERSRKWHENNPEYNKQWRKDNKEHIKEYNEKNKDRINKKHKEYYENNKEQIKEYQKEYRENNSEKLLEKYKEYRENNKEHISEKRKERYEKNKNKEKEYQREYYNKNKEKCKEYQKEYRENNPEKVFNYATRRRQLEENQGEGITKDQWYEMMEFFNWECAYSGVSLEKDNRSIDHIVALNNGGLNEIWNCVPMLRNLNTSKHTSDMLEWYVQQDFYSKERLNKIYEWIEYAFEKWSNQ